MDKQFHSPALWHKIKHPFLWYHSTDLPRLRHNAALPFWKPRFDLWRGELDALREIKVESDTIDFHAGDNKQALKAALCFTVDDNPHYGRLIADFIRAVADVYRRAPDWRVAMCDNSSERRTGQQWSGLSKNHIVDPQMWFSCAHLYDVICGKGFLQRDEAQTFEEMMSLCHQVCCLHEDAFKLDNNRAVWLMGGSYLSTLFDIDHDRATICREQYRKTMYRFLETIFDDGAHYEVGAYASATVAAMQIFARCVRGAEGIDFFREKVNGVGLEEAYRAWCHKLIPGSSLRMPLYKDRVNHWDSICAGYLEYQIPELGWAISRLGDRDWVPMFQHWPQGCEFYTYKQPGHVQAPSFRHSHLKSIGIALLRSSWEREAATLYFRYGFQGSSHGGGLDKLNIELTCNDEPLISDGGYSELSHDKNVVIVDGHCQEQCSGSLLYSDLREDTSIQYISAQGGFGEWPSRSFLRDPRAEVNYWCTKSEECFPGRARMRRTVVQVAKQVYIVRDTLRALDDEEHEYEWLFHTFGDPTVGLFQRRAVFNYHLKRLNYCQRPSVDRRKVDIHLLPKPELRISSAKAALDMKWFACGAELPAEVGLSHALGRYAFNGSSETGDGLQDQMLHRIHLRLKGRDVALTTIYVPYAMGQDAGVLIEGLVEETIEKGTLSLSIKGVPWTIAFDESAESWQASHGI